jgi:hypothetical protein
MDMFSHLPLITLSGDELSYLEGRKLIERIVEITGIEEHAIKDVYYHIKAGGKLRDIYKSAMLAIGCILAGGEIVSPWRQGTTSDGLKKHKKSGVLGGIVKINNTVFFMTLLSIKHGKNNIHPYAIRLYDEEEIQEIATYPSNDLIENSFEWLIKKWVDKCQDRN